MHIYISRREKPIMNPRISIQIQKQSETKSYFPTQHTNHTQNRIGHITHRKIPTIRKGAREKERYLWGKLHYLWRRNPETQLFLSLKPLTSLWLYLTIRIFLGFCSSRRYKYIYILLWYGNDEDILYYIILYYTHKSIIIKGNNSLLSIVNLCFVRKKLCSNKI